MALREWSTFGWASFQHYGAMFHFQWCIGALMPFLTSLTPINSYFEHRSQQCLITFSLPQILHLIPKLHISSSLDLFLVFSHAVSMYVLNLISRTIIEHTRHRLKETTLSPFLINFTAGALSGAISAFVTCPFDVMKTRAQMNLDANTVTTVLALLSFSSSFSFKKLVIRLGDWCWGLDSVPARF